MPFYVIKSRTLKICLAVIIVSILLAVSIDGVSAAQVYFGYPNRKVPVYYVQTEEKRVAISFDAAWGADKTEEIMEILQEYDCNATFFLVGFWTDKGTCDESIQDYLKQLHHQKIFLFGTAGFGGSQDYFDSILKRVQTNIADDNQIVGQFMCQGKMPMSVRQRYEQMAQKQPDRFLPMIDNFDKALSHPNEQDLQSLIQQLDMIS